MIGEFILATLSRDPGEADYCVAEYERKYVDPGIYARSLAGTFPGIGRSIAGMHVLDVGCSYGTEALGLAMLGASKVTGIDIRIDPQKSCALMGSYPEGERCALTVMNAENMDFTDGSFDSAVTCASFEHFENPYTVLKECTRVVRPNGLIFLTSGVWSGPYGAHMNFFTRVPWVQFIFSEKTIMNVRSRYRNDGAKKFCEVEGGLNKVGVSTFREIVRALDLKIDYLKLVPVKKMSGLTRIPVIKEFFTTLIVAVLQKQC